MVTSAPSTLRFGDIMRVPSHRATNRTQCWQSPEPLATSCPPHTVWHHALVSVWGLAEPVWEGMVPAEPSLWDGGFRMPEATSSAPCSPPAAPSAEEAHCGFYRRFSGSVPWSSRICPTAPRWHKDGDSSGVPSSQPQRSGRTIVLPAAVGGSNPPAQFGHTGLGPALLCQAGSQHRGEHGQGTGPCAAPGVMAS